MRARALVRSLSQPGAQSVLFALVGALAIAIVLALGTADVERRRDEAEEWHAHSLQVVSSARSVLSQAQDMEAGQRGYLLTRVPAYLAPFHAASANIDTDLGALQALTRDNPRQIERMQRLQNLVGMKRSEMLKTLARAREGRWGAAVGIVQTGEGKALMDELRSVVDAVVAEEQRLLARRAAESRAASATSQVYLFALGVLGVALLFLAATAGFSAVGANARATAERKRSDLVLDLARSQRGFRAITEAMPQFVWSTTATGQSEFFNKRWREYTGALSEETGWLDHVHPDERGGAEEVWKVSLADGSAYEQECRLRAADGSYRWYLCRAQASRDLSGNVERWFGTCTDIHEARLNLEARETLSQELSHRIKNIFAVIGSLIALSARDNPDHKRFAADLRARVNALSRAHDFVRPDGKEGDGARSFAGFLMELLGAYSHGSVDRVKISGDDVSFGATSATPLALFFHELGTNAAKYGALSEVTGRVEIACQRETDVFVVVWRERGGPPVDGAPAREGFGTTLARLSIEQQLGGSVLKEWARDGLRVTVSIPLVVLDHIEA